MNTWASFNGLSLLDGQGGITSLQVGANDNETINVDLGPPGFSVKALGLWDMNIQGTPASLTPVSTLTGASSQINLDDATHTTVSYVPPDNSPNLARPSRSGSRDVVQVDGDGGRLMEASISASHDTDTRDNTVCIGVSSAVLTSTARESISSWRYQDSSGNAIPTTNTQLVQANGKYWIQQGSENNASYYEAELTIEGDQHRITAQAKNDTRLTQGMLGGVAQRILSAPAVAISSADYQLSLDGADETANADLALVHLGGYYYVEEQVSAGQYAYYRADVTIKTGGAQNAISVVSDRSQAITVSDQPYVSGTSTAHLEPENNNVQVNYVDRAGGIHTDVMRDDGDGGYVFNVEEFINGEGANKTAKVVRGDNGGYLLHTVNGMGDVVLYYPMTYSVSTNVENNRTILTVREADDAQRLRTPPNPLAAIDQAISRVDAKRGQLGALENRLESEIQGNTSTSLSLAASRSRILDADYAVEVSHMTRAQMVEQASNSLLAQANQLPETVLTLLQSR